MIKTIAPLKQVFANNDFAWEILEQEIKLESGIGIDGQDIANLLGLYMRGVETLNSVRDPRELYFRNRLNNLMMKPNVVKVLSSDKKNKQPKQNQKVIKAQNALGTFRKGELEMKLTYAKQDNNEEKLKNMVVEHNSKINSITGTVSNAIDKSRSKLEQRINQRRLKSATARERSVMTEQKIQKAQQKNNMEVLDQIKEQQQKEHTKKKTRQRSHSFDLKAGINYQSFIVQVPTTRRVSLLLPSRRKQSE